MESGLAPFSAYRTRQTNGDNYIDGLAVTGVNTYRGDPTNIARLANVSYSLIWTGTPAGTFTIQVSNKDSPDATTDTDWTTLTLAAAITQPAGAAGNDFIDLAGLPARWVRPKYVNASGSGSIFAWVAGKS